MKHVVAGVVWRGDRFIVIRRGRNLSAFPGVLCFPGGNVEVEDHTFKAAVEREIFEELGLKLKAESMMPSFTFNNESPEFSVKFFNMLLPDGDFTLHIPFREVEEVLFLTAQELRGMDTKDLIPSLAAWIADVYAD